MEFKLNKNGIFELGWVILLFYYLFIASSEFNLMYSTTPIKYITYILVITLWTFKIFKDKYKLYIFILMFFCITIVGIVSILSSREILLLMIMFVIAAKDIDIKHFIKVDMQIRLLIIVILFILSITGIITNFSREINGSLKYAFGWQHPNTCASAIVLVLLEWIYIKWDKFRWNNWIVVLMTLIFLIKFIAARTSIISFGVLCIWFIIIQHIKLKENSFYHKVFGAIYTISYPLVAGISFFLVSQYQKGTTFGIIPNQLMTTRLKYSSYYLINYGISFLGQPIETISTRIALLSGTVYSGIDMAFINMAIQYGSLYTIIFLCIYIYICYGLYRGNHYPELLLVLFFVAVGLSSNAMIIFYRNFTMIFIWLVYKENKARKTLSK